MTPKTSANRKRKVTRIAVDESEAQIQAMLHDPEPDRVNRVQNGSSYRVTPYARAFIVTCILAGYTNQQISELLRQHKFILPGEPDLSDETLRRIRRSDDCQLDPSLLTAEARQVGHNMVSRLIVYWGELAEKAFGLLLRDEASFKKFRKLSTGEVLSMARASSDILMDIFAKGLGDSLQKELELANITVEQEQTATGGLTVERYVETLENIMAANYDRAVEMVQARQAREQESAKDEGEQITP